MHKTISEALDFISEVKGKAEVTGVETILCAPFTTLSELVKAVAGTKIHIGAQNLHFEDQGAFTGEVSGPMLADLGVTHVIIGHSERRAYFAESDEAVNKKVHSAFANKLTPIVCVGELLEEREAGQTAEVVKRQTEAALQKVTAERAAKVIIAYEPIWAIGTGKSSTAEDANEVIAGIRQTIAELYDLSLASQVRILYGGSVKPSNIAEFIAQPEIDGALVGGASLEPDSFIALVEGAATDV